MGKWHTPNYYKSLAATVLLSAVSHILITFFLGQKHKTDAELIPSAVKVRIVETTIPKPPIPETKPITPATKATANPSVKPAGKHTSEEAPNAEDVVDDEPTTSVPTAYKDFFPGPTWPSGSVVGNSTRSPTIVSSETKKISGHLEGQLDIPLVFRENTATSKAVAKFNRTEDGTWIFEYIDGEPVLRAVVFQAFKNKKNLDKIIDLSAELKSNEIIFVLEQITKPALNGMKHFEDGMTFSGTRIIYTRMIFTGHDGSSGMPLPDKEAKRAKMRDQVALKRLMDSPAYHSPIRNRKID